MRDLSRLSSIYRVDRQTSTKASAGAEGISCEEVLDGACETSSLLVWKQRGLAPIDDFAMSERNETNASAVVARVSERDRGGGENRACSTYSRYGSRKTKS